MHSSHLVRRGGGGGQVTEAHSIGNKTWAQFFGFSFPQLSKCKLSRAHL